MTPEKRKTAIEWLQDEIRSLRLAPKINGCGPENWADLLEIMETCLEAVRGHGNKPLTLEQLREMDGKPYWHIGIQNDSPKPNWKILDPFVAKHPEDYGYGKRWIAYAYPPAHIDLGCGKDRNVPTNTVHIDREAWEKPCGMCGGKTTLYQHTNTTKLFMNTFGEAATLVAECMACPPYADCCMKGISANSAFKINFCPECGRPLTEEAWAELEKRLRG